MTRRKKDDIFQEFLSFPAPDPESNNEDVWFDVISVGSYIAGIGQRIRGAGGGANLDPHEISSLRFPYLINIHWTCSAEGGKAVKLDANSNLYRYALLIQKCCNQLQSEI